MLQPAALPKGGFYTYIHRRGDDGKVFYVGKGKGARANSAKNRNPHWQNIVKKHGGHVEIVAQWPVEADAFDHEALLVACFRDMGHPLCNMTDGGDGISGFKHTAETIAKHFGKPVSAESRAKIGNANRGRVRSPEVRARIAESLRGRKRPPEVIAKISASQKGKVIPLEMREQISKTLTGRRHSPESLKNLRASLQSPERRAKQSAAMAGRPWSEARRAAQKAKAKP